MDYLIANVAKKKGIRTGVVLAGYDLDRKEPTAVAGSADLEARLTQLEADYIALEARVTVLETP